MAVLLVKVKRRAMNDFGACRVLKLILSDGSSPNMTLHRPRGLDAWLSSVSDMCNRNGKDGRNNFLMDDKMVASKPAVKTRALPIDYAQAIRVAQIAFENGDFLGWRVSMRQAANLEFSATMRVAIDQIGRTPRYEERSDIRFNFNIAKFIVERVVQLAETDRRLALQGLLETVRRTPRRGSLFDKVLASFAALDIQIK